jgi:hypothetical protein
VGTINAASNGRRRKTLADQLDRLDTILDGLDAALTAVVAQAVGDSVRRAVDELVRQQEGFGGERPTGSAPGRAWHGVLQRACGRTGATVYAAASTVGGAIRRAWGLAAARPHPQRVQ